MANNIQTLPESELKANQPSIQTHGPIPNQQIQPPVPKADPLYSGLEVKNKPTLPDYLEEANKITTAQSEVARQQMNMYTEDLGEDVARRVYGQNVGATSGVGKTIVSDAIQNATDRFSPYLADIQNRAQERGLNYYEKQLQNSQARSQKLEDERRQFENKYGNVNPETGRSWTSIQEANMYWDQKQKSQSMETQSGSINPDTNQPFASQREADLYWKNKEQTQDVEAEFGTNTDTKKPFTSAIEAKTFWDDKRANSISVRNRASLYGSDEFGKPFDSDMQAKEYWTEQVRTNSFIADLAEKYGQNPDTKKPFESYIEAEKFGQGSKFKQKMDQEYGTNPTTKKSFESIRQAEEYKEQRSTRLTTLFQMALSGDLKGKLLPEILAEYGMTESDVNIPEVHEQTVMSYIESKIANDQPINISELNSILGLTGLDLVEEDKDMFLSSPTFAKSILSTDNEDLKNYLADKGFNKETKYKGDFLGTRWDGYWEFKQTPANLSKFKQLYKSDTEFRNYVNNFLT